LERTSQDMSAGSKPTACFRYRIASAAKAIVLLLGLFAIGIYSYAQIVGTRFNIDESGAVNLQHFGSDDAYYILKRGESLVGVFTTKDIVLGEAKLIDYSEVGTPLQNVFYQLDEIPLSRPLDSDRDGIDDAFELSHPALLDPLNPDDADLDPDNDSRTNFEEYVDGTDIAAVSNLEPTVSLTSPISGGGYVSPGEVDLLAVAGDADGQIAKVEFFEGNNKIGEALSAPYAFTWQSVPEGEYVLTAKATDDAASSISTLGTLVTVIGANTAPLTTIVGASPGDGQEGVAVTRETIIRFFNPLDAATQIGSETLKIESGGTPLAASYTVSKDFKTVTAFFDSNLPADSKIDVTFDASGVNDLAGRKVDADKDGSEGGVYSFSYNTLSVSSVANTLVCGRVFASRLEGGNAGGSINIPLAGVKITVDGKEDEIFAFTYEFGDFRLENAHAGRFFVHIDGREVVRVEEGIRFPDMGYYPFIGKTWASIPGEETNIGEVFLPLVNGTSLQDVSDTKSTLIGFPLEVIKESPEVKDVVIEVPADSLFRDDGTRGGRVGIAPVPPDRSSRAWVQTWWFSRLLFQDWISLKWRVRMSP